MSNPIPSLPPPQIIEELDFEAIYAAIKADFLARWDELRADDPALPAFNTLDLDSEPVAAVLQAATYREMILRARINDAIRANLLAFALASDLDQLAAFYGVDRAVLDPGDPTASPPRPPVFESDTRFRARINDRIRGFSTAGGAAHYRYWTLTSSPLVADAAVSSPQSGQVAIAVLSTQGDGTASDALLEQVRSVVLADDVRVLTDTVVIASARIITVDIEARVWLLPDTPIEVFDGLEARLRAAHSEEGGLGWDLTDSWIIAQLHPRGVFRVDLLSPAASVVALADEATAIGTVTLTFAGRDR